MEARKVDRLTYKYNIYPYDAERCGHLLHKATVIHYPSLKCRFFEFFVFFAVIITVVGLGVSQYEVWVRVRGLGLAPNPVTAACMVHMYSLTTRTHEAYGPLRL